MKKGRVFNPSEIIFSVTDKCNLNCTHCWAHGGENFLDAEKAICFLKSCVKSSQSSMSSIETIGFSGGEPFLGMDFIEKVCAYAVQNDFFFDRIITNGVWWKDEQELCEKLNRLYNSGFDGKIALSFDSFHGQSVEKMANFCKKATEIFKNDRIIEIQSTVNSQDKKNPIEIEFLEKLHSLANMLDCSFEASIDKKTGCGQIVLKSENFFITVDRTIQVLESKNPLAWQAKHWFKEDFCENLGHILFVHSNGKIAPCCGFANDENGVIIGDINQTFEEIMQKALENKMMKLCFEDGLSSKIKDFKSKLPGKTDNPCTFCQFLCEQYSTE